MPLGMATVEDIYRKHKPKAFEADRRPSTPRSGGGSSCGSRAWSSSSSCSIHLYVMHVVGAGVERVDFAFVASDGTTSAGRRFDWIMLFLALLHGANGLRIIIDDYVHSAGLRTAIKGSLYAVTVILMIMGTAVIVTFDPATAASFGSASTTTTRSSWEREAPVLGRRSNPGNEVQDRRRLEALPDPVPHRGGAGRNVRRARQRRRGLVGMACVRHRQGRRLPRGSGRRRRHVQGSRGLRLAARADGPPVQPHTGRKDRSAALRWTHQEPRRGSGEARLLRRRPHRSHDPSDPVPAMQQARRRVLQRVLRPRPHHGRRSLRRDHRLRDRNRRAPRLPRQVGSVRDRRLREDVQDHFQRPHPDRRRARASSTGRVSRSKTWSSSSSTPPVSTGSASCCPRRRAARAGSSAMPTANVSWSGMRRRSRTWPRATWSRAPSSSRSRRAAARALRRTTSSSTSPHVDPEVVETKLPDITEFARTYLGVDPLKEGVPIVPTAHYAMGGIPDERRGRGSPRSHRRRRPWVLRGGRVCMRVRARGQPAGDQLAPRHRRVRAAGRHRRWPSTQRPVPCPRSPTTSRFTPRSGCDPSPRVTPRSHPTRSVRCCRTR